MTALRGDIEHRLRMALNHGSPTIRGQRLQTLQSLILVEMILLSGIGLAFGGWQHCFQVTSRAVTVLAGFVIDVEGMG